MMYQGPPRKVVIDTDPGVDDAAALFLALAAHKSPTVPFEIVGITTVLGNTSVDNACKNVFIVLDCAGVNNIPVYCGAAKPLVQPFIRDESPYHGKDGFGDVQSSPNLPLVKQNRQLDQEYAPLALVRLARELQGELTVVALGPLTNLAIACNADPNFAASVKELHIMGGNIHSVGNIRACCEFNFYVDPEAAFVVLAAAWKQNIILTPWEACRSAMSQLDWRKNELGSLQTNQIKLMNMIEEKVMVRNAQRYGKWMSADAVCMAALLNPKGAHTRGQMVVDYPGRTGKAHNVSIIEKVDLPQMEELLLSTFRDFPTS